MIDFLGFLRSKQGKAGQPGALELVELARHSLARSALSIDVLAKDAASGEASSAGNAKKTDTSPLSQRLSVGARLADARERATALASRLIALAEGETAEALKVLVQDLDSRVCCIAITGQVKAGKSSLISVLVEEPELLPADINPWTAVITKLHFGAPGKPQSGASFKFFTCDEWRRLSYGGHTRELTERICPDFDWNALKAQVEAMQERAARKLGPRFEDLLGTAHAHPVIVPGLLNRYVGAGEPDEGPASGGEGEYSDITKVANVYFDLGAFSFPTTLIDTPGVNDPFLVRDEITRQNLESADICVVVLTARQPLSTADLSLLRLLRGLNRKGVIVFINKSDEIAGGEEVLNEVSRRVEAVLQQEFPSASIQIVCGSAILARKALNSRLVERGAKPATAPVREISGSGAAFDWPSQAEIADSVSAETLLMKSGLSSLAVAISEAMQAGPVAEAIESATALAEAVCWNLIIWLEIEINIMSKVLTDAGAAKKELSQLIALREALSAEFDACSGKLAALLDENVSRLHPTLARTVEDSLAGRLAGLPPGELATHASQIDIKLRIKLESVFLAAFEDAIRLFVAEQERLGSELGKQFEAAGLAGRLTIIPGHPFSVSPSLAALSEPAPLNLTAGLAAYPVPPDGQGSNLARAIIASFEPIIEKLAGEAAKALNEKATALLQRVRALTLAPLEASVGRLSACLQQIEPNSAHRPAAQETLQQEMEAIRERTANLRLILAAHTATAPGRDTANG